MPREERRPSTVHASPPSPSHLKARTTERCGLLVQCPQYDHAWPAAIRKVVQAPREGLAVAGSIRYGMFRSSATTDGSAVVRDVLERLHPRSIGLVAGGALRRVVAVKGR